MPRDPRAYLTDIIESCEAINSAVDDMDLEEYQSNRLVRSSVEREFIIIGEAISALSHTDPDIFQAITRARRIIDFRNLLTHEYPTIDDALVWAVVQTDIPVLLSECRNLVSQSSGEV